LTRPGHSQWSWSPETRGDSRSASLRCRRFVTYGRDEDEALAMAEDAIRLVLEDMTARGEPIPPIPAPRIREVTVTLAA
jgi:hypothetical protein